MSINKKTKKKFFVWTYGLVTDMSDNKKRADIDKQLKWLYPDFTHEQIVNEREEFLRSKSSYKYPRPMERTLIKHTEDMSFDKLLKIFSLDKTKAIAQYIIGAIAFLALAGPVISLLLTLLMQLDFIEVRVQVFITFLLISIITFVIIGIGIKKTVQENYRVESAIKKRQIKIKCYRVLDTGTFAPEPGDESSSWGFYLVLSDYNKKDNWHYKCSRSDYEKYRNNDYLCAVFLNAEEVREKHYLFVFHYAEWNYDEEMKSTLEKEIARYK